jgi:transposase
MATGLLDDELWRLIGPLLPARERRFRHAGRKRLMTAARLPASCSCCVPGSLSAVEPMDSSAFRLHTSGSGSLI